MREIKFRGWDWEYMHYDIDFKDWYWGVLSWFQWFNRENTLMKSSPIMQYTGLKDKNWKEIYEGDIIWRDYYCCEDKVNWYSVVDFSEWCFLCNDDNRPEFVQREIIWNIYENPELLTKE